jgi:hypothetical protein
MHYSIAEACEIDWLIKRACDLFSPNIGRGSEATERRMGRDVVLQPEEIVRLVVGIAAANARTILRDVSKWRKDKSAFAVSPRPATNAKLNTRVSRHVVNNPDHRQSPYKEYVDFEFGP